MKVKVDEDACTGCELCAINCPAVFRMEGDLSKVIVDEVPLTSRECVREAADECPVAAIEIVED